MIIGGESMDHSAGKEEELEEARVDTVLMIDHTRTVQESTLPAGWRPGLEIFRSAGNTVSHGLYIFDFSCNAVITYQYYVLDVTWGSFPLVFMWVLVNNVLPYIASAMGACCRACRKSSLPPDQNYRPMSLDEAYIAPLIQFRRLVPEILSSMWVCSKSRHGSESTESLDMASHSATIRRACIQGFQASQGFLIQIVVIAVVSANSMYNLWNPRLIFGFCAMLYAIGISYIYGTKSKYHSSVRWGIRPGIGGVTGRVYILTVLILRCATLAAVLVWFRANGVPLLLTIYTAGVYLVNIVGPGLRRLGEGWAAQPLDSCMFGGHFCRDSHLHDIDVKGYSIRDEEQIELC